MKQKGDDMKQKSVKFFAFCKYELIEVEGNPFHHNGREFVVHENVGDPKGSCHFAVSDRQLGLRVPGVYGMTRAAAMRDAKNILDKQSSEGLQKAINKAITMRAEMNFPQDQNGEFAAMLLAHQAEQNRLRAASVVSEFKLLPPKLQTETLAYLNQFCLREKS